MPAGFAPALALPDARKHRSADRPTFEAAALPRLIAPRVRLGRFESSRSHLTDGLILGHSALARVSCITTGFTTSLAARPDTGESGVSDIPTLKTSTAPGRAGAGIRFKRFKLCRAHDGHGLFLGESAHGSFSNHPRGVSGALYRMIDSGSGPR